MSGKLIIDTGYFLALFDKNDSYHQKAIDLRSKISKKKWVTTWPIITEVSYFLMKRGNAQKVKFFLELYEKNYIEVFSLTQQHIPRICSLIEKYADLPMDLADASLVILAEDMHLGDIVSTDTRDFAGYRWKTCKPFHNLFS